MALLKATCRFSNQELAAASAHQAHTTFIRQKRGEQAGLTPAAYSVPASAATVWHSVNKGGKQKQNKKSTPKGTPPMLPRSAAEAFSSQQSHQLHELTERLHCLGEN